MSEKEWIFRVQDMLKCIDEIESFTAGLSAASFAEDRKAYRATERNIEIIAEASKYIPDSIKDSYPAIGWKKIVGIRNVITHAYDGIEEDIVWLVVEKRLPELKAVLQAILQT